MDLSELIRRLDRVEKNLPRRIQEAEMRTVRRAQAEARKLSSGTFSTARLRQMGHPYAKRNPRPPQDEAIVNAQSGVFRDAWQTRGVAVDADGTITALVNDSENAGRLVSGRGAAIARPIDVRIVERVQPQRLAFATEAVRRLIS